MRDSGPTTSTELAADTGLVERYVQEWLAGMAVAGWLAYEPAEGRFTLTSVWRAKCGMNVRGIVVFRVCLGMVCGVI